MGGWPNHPFLNLSVGFPLDALTLASTLGLENASARNAALELSLRISLLSGSREQGRLVSCKTRGQSPSRCHGSGSRGSRGGGGGGGGGFGAGEGGRFTASIHHGKDGGRGRMPGAPPEPSEVSARAPEHGAAVHAASAIVRAEGSGQRSRLWSLVDFGG